MPERATILVIEDDTRRAQLQQKRLEHEGYRVLRAPTAEQGKRCALSEHVDLIVLNQRLPAGTNDLEICRQLKAVGCDVPSILVTAVSDEKTVLDALRAGMDDFVPRTAKYLDHLLPAIKRVLKEKRTERQLADSRAQLADVIESAMNAVLTVDEQHRVAVFNPAAEDIFQCPAKEARGAAVQRFLPDWSELLAACPDPPEGPPGRQVLHVETEGRRGSTSFPLELSLSRGRRQKAWTCIARDLTERRRAQEEHYRLLEEKAGRLAAEAAEGKLRQFVDKLQQQTHLLEFAHALVRDGQDRIISWNKGTTQMYGWTEQEALGQNIHALLKTIFPVPLKQIEQELRNKGTWEGELLHTRKDGSTLVAASHWALHRDEKGATVAVLEVNNDITELKRLQEALREADRRKDEFLATLAHELRNPLAPIRNTLHLMRLTQNDPASVERSREMMERQVKHMVRLIDDLLELSRLSRGKIQLKKERASLQELVSGAVEASRPWIDSLGHTLTVEVPDEPIWLEVDPVRIGQVLQNLLNNAAKYTEPGGRIGFSAEVSAQDETTPGEVALRIADSGVGIPAEMLPRIFEMFTQLEPSADRTQGGLGIGLSLVRGLVALHGGRVEARSEGLGRGSEFIVRLPLPRLRAPRATPAPMAAEAGSNPAVLRILVVDDNRDAAESLALVLNAMGHDVDKAHDGLSAVDAARRLHPHVVFCDIGLPGIDGYEVAQRLRAQPGAFHDTMLVALTGWGQEDDRRRAQEAGFDAHLVKPVEEEALMQILAAVGVTADAGA